MGGLWGHFVYLRAWSSSWQIKYSNWEAKITSSKKIDSQFSKKLIISSYNFQKAVRNSRIAKPHFSPCFCHVGAKGDFISFISRLYQTCLQPSVNNSLWMKKFCVKFFYFKNTCPVCWRSQNFWVNYFAAFQLLNVCFCNETVSSNYTKQN